MIDVSFFFGYSLFFSVSISVSLSLSLDAKSTSLEVSVRLGYALARHPNLLDAIWRLIWCPRVLALYIFISLQLFLISLPRFLLLWDLFSFLVGGEGVIVTLVGVDAFSLMYIILTRVYHDQGDAHF